MHCMLISSHNFVTIAFHTIHINIFKAYCHHRDEWHGALILCWITNVLKKFKLIDLGRSDGNQGIFSTINTQTTITIGYSYKSITYE